MRFFVKRREDKRLRSPNAAEREAALAASGTTPERLMASITNSMGEIVNDKDEFDELLVLLIYKAPKWVKEVAIIREQNVGSEMKEGKRPKPLIL